MKSHEIMLIDWKGPYEQEQVEGEGGLYLVSGKLRNKQRKDIHYCGITQRDFKGRFSRHHKIDEINRERRFWLGHLVFPHKKDRSYLELAESIIIYFWQPTLNERKTVNPPRPTTLINRWFKKDGVPRLRQDSICKELPDVLSWDGRYWRTGNLIVWEEEGWL